MNDNASTQPQITAGNMFLGYFIACGASSVAFMMLYVFTTNDSRPIGMEALLGMTGVTGMFFMLTCVTALPGFVVMRAILRLFRRADWPSFVVAGALNAALVVDFFLGPKEISMAWLFCGGLAGVAACLSERYFARQTNKKAFGA